MLADELLTLDDVNLESKKVLLRVDINSPLDPQTGEILDDSRLRSHIPTINKLSDAKVVILAHQSRPGKNDFTTLERHANRLSSLLGIEVKYIDDVFSSHAKKEINKLDNGEILMLENVRFCSEEIAKEVTSKPPSEQAKTHLVRKLSSYVDFFVNDAFAVSHRSQPSIVGFPIALPSCIGLEMEKEIRMLSEALESNARPKIFSLGGVKADDSMKIIKNLFSKNIADRILLSGVVSIIFLKASGINIGRKNENLLAELNLTKFIPEAEHLLKKYRNKLLLPVDFAFEKNNKRYEKSVEKINNERILDIGEKTIEIFKEEIKKAKIIAANGPCGVFEMPGFEKGTVEILKAMGNAKALSIIGGGHLRTVAERNGIGRKITHMSSGGGACVAFLSGEALPGIEIMKRHKKQK